MGIHALFARRAHELIRPVVLFMLTSATTLCAVVLGSLLYRRLFTAAWQLRRDLLD